MTLYLLTVLKLEQGLAGWLICLPTALGLVSEVRGATGYVQKQRRHAQRVPTLLLASYP